jgi:hypothetical protein
MSAALRRRIAKLERERPEIEFDQAEARARSGG